MLCILAGIQLGLCSMHRGEIMLGMVFLLGINSWVFTKLPECKCKWTINYKYGEPNHFLSLCCWTGLGPPSLHQTLPPGYPTALTGSIPPPYQFARDPQTGQVVVIQTEHLPHYGRPVYSPQFLCSYFNIFPLTYKIQCAFIKVSGSDIPDV